MHESTHFHRQRRRSGSSIIVLDGDTALKKPTGFEYLDMLPSDQDTGNTYLLFKKTLQLKLI